MDTRKAPQPAGLAPVAAAQTHQAHIAGAAIAARGNSFAKTGTKGWETTSAGNSVVLEEQMMKVSADHFDF